MRFAVVGWLLAAPPENGELRAAITDLAQRTWQHPTTGEPVRFGFSTIERWYYRAVAERTDPVGVLRRKVRCNAGQQHTVSDAVRRAVLAQYAAHKGWSVQLHHDNLVALAETQPDLKPVPSYPTLRRFMRANGLDKRRRLTPRTTRGAEQAEARIADREIRSYESEYVNALWHWDCHHCSRKVLTARGEWVTPILFGVLDDRSRLACHLQWYLAETAQIIAHGLSQAFQKRGLPRAGLSDNGPAMTAAEITEGLTRLGILHQTTLPYSPYQNAKQEAFWGPVEGRLVAMLEHVPDLTLAFLNEATQAWVEQDYNGKIHSEIGEAPITRFLAGPEVTRPCPDSDTLRLVFTRTDHRMARKSDGSVVIEGRRFESRRRAALTNDLDAEATRCRGLRRIHVAECNGLADTVPEAPRGDPADHLVVMPDRLIADGIGVRRFDSECDELALPALLLLGGRCCAADEVALCEVDEASEPRLVRSVNGPVLARPAAEGFFETHGVQRTPAERSQAVGPAAIGQQVVERTLVIGCHPDLVAEIARERDPSDEGGNHADVHAAE